MKRHGWWPVAALFTLYILVCFGFSLALGATAGWVAQAAFIPVEAIGAFLLSRHLIRRFVS